MYILIMGINRREMGMSPPEFGVWDANAIVPPYFVMFQNLKHQIACITILQRSKKAYQPHVCDRIFITSQNAPKHAIFSPPPHTSSPH